MLAKHQYLLEEILDPAVIPLMSDALIEYLLANDMAEALACAARCLYVNRDNRGKDIFLRSLLNGDRNTRKIFLNIFSVLTDKYVQTMFEEALNREPDADLCLEFARNLIKVSENKKVIHAITSELESPDPHRRWMAVHVAGKLPTPCIDLLLKHALQGEPDRALRRLISRMVTQE